MNTSKYPRPLLFCVCLVFIASVMRKLEDAYASPGRVERDSVIVPRLHRKTTVRRRYLSVTHVNGKMLLAEEAAGGSDDGSALYC